MSRDNGQPTALAVEASHAATEFVSFLYSSYTLRSGVGGILDDLVGVVRMELWRKNEKEEAKGERREEKIRDVKKRKED